MKMITIETTIENAKREVIEDYKPILENYKRACEEFKGMNWRMTDYEGLYLVRDWNYQSRSGITYSKVFNKDFTFDHKYFNFSVVTKDEYLEVEIFPQSNTVGMYEVRVDGAFKAELNYATKKQILEFLNERVAPKFDISYVLENVRYLSGRAE